MATDQKNKYWCHPGPLYDGDGNNIHRCRVVSSGNEEQKQNTVHGNIVNLGVGFRVERVVLYIYITAVVITTMITIW